MNPCDVDLLSQYVDGGLMLPQRVALEHHLRLCSGCTEEVSRLLHIDRRLAGFGSVRTPLPVHVERRIASSIEKKARVPSILSLSRMMPAAVGSSIAAVLVLLSVNLGVQYGASPQPTATSRTPTTAHAIVKQSAALIKLRRTSALIGGYATVHPVAESPLLKRAQLDIN